MKWRRAVLVLAFFCGPASGQDPEDFAFWLEAIPGTTSVVVCGSWTADHVQGWSFGLCHDPAEATIGEPTQNCYDHEGESFHPRCPSVDGTSDLFAAASFGPPDFLSVNIYENGLTMGACLIGPAAVTYDPTDRYELLQITYTPRAESAAIEFCADTFGSPPVPNEIVNGGVGYVPARQDGVVVDFGPAFIRGDSNADGAVDIADAVFLFQHLFRGGRPPSCRRACDANDDSALDVADVIAILGHLFAGRGPLPEPHGACGRSAARGPGLECAAYEPCE